MQDLPVGAVARGEDFEGQSGGGEGLDGACVGGLAAALGGEDGGDGGEDVVVCGGPLEFEEGLDGNWVGG